MRAAKVEAPDRTAHDPKLWTPRRDGRILLARCAACGYVARALTPTQLAIWQHEHERDAHRLHPAERR